MQYPLNCRQVFVFRHSEKKKNRRALLKYSSKERYKCLIQKLLNPYLLNDLEMKFSSRSDGQFVLAIVIAQNITLVVVLVVPRDGNSFLSRSTQCRSHYITLIRQLYTSRRDAFRVGDDQFNCSFRPKRGKRNLFRMEREKSSSNQCAQRSIQILCASSLRI